MISFRRPFNVRTGRRMVTAHDKLSHMKQFAEDVVHVCCDKENILSESAKEYHRARLRELRAAKRQIYRYAQEFFK